MKIEHTRSHGFDGSPRGKKWWTIEHNGNQYVVKREFNSSGIGGDYEFIVEHRHGLDLQTTVKVKVTPTIAKVSCGECDFIDVTLAVQAAMFIEKEQEK